MKRFFYVLFIISANLLVAQKKVSKKDSLLIVKTLFQQQAVWNRGDIDAFMEGYIKSDALVFSGASTSRKVLPNS